MARKLPLPSHCTETRAEAINQIIYKTQYSSTTSLKVLLINENSEIFAEL